MDTLALFERRDLPKGSRFTYLALLAKHPATVAEIARSSGLHRPDVYKAIPSLMES